MKYLKFLYLSLPIIAAGLHYGPGQVLQTRQEASDALQEARAAMAAEDFAGAAAAFATAKDTLAKTTETLRVGLDEALALRRAGEILDAQERLESLLDQAVSAGLGDAELGQSLRHELAKTHYYMAWLMRLEGASEAEWKPDSEIARQNFRLLAERAPAKSGAAQTHREDLEAAIRLQRMDLKDLVSMALPKDCCCNCDSLSQRKRKQRKSKAKKKGKGKGKKKDARQKVKGAGKNNREGSGS